MVRSQITERISKLNFYSYIWHASFLALAQNFMDVNTVIPAMMIDVGGTSLQVGILTAIMIGGTNFSQLIFLPFLSNKPRKKPYLLFSINLRIIALFGLGFVLYSYSSTADGSIIILLIFLLMTLFAVSGSFAGISYSDILGRSIQDSQRKQFFSLRQAISSIGMLISAFFAARILAGFQYPNNYALLFTIAAIALGVASLGFWNIKEFAGPVRAISGISAYLRLIVGQIRANRRLSSYLLLVNTLGVSLSLLPFLTMYGKEVYAITSGDVGRNLIFSVTGGVLTGGALYLYSKRVRYGRLLYVIVGLAIVIPVMVIVWPSEALFGLYFFLGGIMVATYKITIEGVLLEVSDNQNRTITIGLAGAGSIIPALFPILGGWMVHRVGYTMFFSLFIVIILSAVFFIRRLDCQK